MTMIKNVISRDAAIRARYLDYVWSVCSIASTAVTVERSTRIVKLALRGSRGMSSVSSRLFPAGMTDVSVESIARNLINESSQQRQ